MDQEILRPAAISGGWRKLAVLRHTFRSPWWRRCHSVHSCYTWIPWHGYQFEEYFVAAQAPVHIRWKVFLPFCGLSLSASSEIDVGCTFKLHLFCGSLKEATHPTPPHLCVLHSVLTLLAACQRKLYHKKEALNKCWHFWLVFDRCQVSDLELGLQLFCGFPPSILPNTAVVLRAMTAAVHILFN